MRSYFVPGQCADCGTPTHQLTRCPSCGLLQTGRVADDLRTSLQRTDEILAYLRRMSASQPEAAPAPEPATEPATGPAPSPAPAPTSAPTSAPAPAATPRRGLPSVSVPVVLLGLGTVCVLVAAIVFVAVTWTDLSLAWRSTILVAVTAIGVGAAVWAMRKGLRGATEALTLVASGLLLIDLVAGNDAGLPAVSALHGTAFGWLVSSTMLVTGVGWVLLAQRTPTRSLLGEQVVAVLATLAVVYLAVVGWDYGYDWLSAVVVVVAAVLGLAWWWLRLRVVAVASAVVAIASWLALVTLGLERAVAADGPRQLFVQLDAAPLLVASALAAVLAFRTRLHLWTRTTAAVFAVAGPVVVALLPVQELTDTTAVVVAAAAAVVLVVAALRVRAPWQRALHVVGLGTTVLPVLVLASGVLLAVVRVTRSGLGYWERGLTDPLVPLVAPPAVQIWSLVPVGGLVAAAVATVLAGRVRPVLVWVGGGLATGAVTALLLTSWPVLVVALLLAVAAAAATGLAVLSGLRRDAAAGLWLVPTGVLVALGLAAALPSVAATAVFFVVHAVLLLVVAWLLGDTVARLALTAGAVVVLGLAVEAGCEVSGLPGPTSGVVLLLFASVAVSLAQWVARRRHGTSWRLGLESATALLAVVGLYQAFDAQAPRTIGLAVVALVTAGVAVVSRDRRLLACVSAVFVAATAHQVVQWAGGAVEWRAVAAACVAAVTGLGAQATARPGTRDLLRRGLEGTAVAIAVVALEDQITDSLALSVGLTVLGVGAVLVSFVSADRRRVAWAGSALLVLASWVRLRGLDVDVIEAYTLPGATALLVAGLVWMRRNPSATSWQALAAPLSLGVGPSLIVALEEPTSLRALAVGLVGVGLVVAAVRLQWGAPLVVGGVAVATLALVNIAPYAAGLPRWVLFGVAGVALLGLGVTWERRRRDLAVVHSYATRLR